MTIEINIKKQAETETNAMLPMLIPSCMGALVASVLVGCGFVPDVNTYIFLCALVYVLIDIGITVESSNIHYLCVCYIPYAIITLGNTFTFIKIHQTLIYELLLRE